MTASSRHHRADVGTLCAQVRDRVEAACVALAEWATRDDSEAQAQVREAANTAVDEVDAALADLHRIRVLVIDQMRESDEATIRRVDALLARRRAERGEA